MGLQARTFAPQHSTALSLGVGASGDKPRVYLFMIHFLQLTAGCLMGN